MYLTLLISQDISLRRDQRNEDTGTNQFNLCEVLAFINRAIVKFLHAIFRNNRFNVAFTAGVSKLPDLIFDRARFYSE